MFQFEFENGLFTLNAAPTRSELLQFAPRIRTNGTAPASPLDFTPFLIIYFFLSCQLYGAIPQSPRPLRGFNRVFISR